MTSSIASLLPSSHVLLDVDASSKKEIFQRVAQLLTASTSLSSAQIVDSLLARERLGSTGLGQGIAIPHGRVKGLREAVGAFVRLRTPLAFEAPDARPVSLLFVLLVPERATDTHLQILSELAQMFSQRELRTQLGSAADAGTAQSLLTGWLTQPANKPN